MLKYLLILLFYWAANMAHAQFIDSFSDKDFDKNPYWHGDSLHFEITDSLALHLNAPATQSTSSLSTKCKAIKSASWECLVKMDFNPSSANKCRFIIASNQANLNTPFDGYFVEVGSTNDNIALYRKDGSSSIKMIEGRHDMLDVSKPTVRVKATVDSIGNWALYADSTGSNTFQLLGITNDLTHTKSEYTGVWCDYTSSRSTKFWFDDFIVNGDTFPDVYAPVILSHQLFSDSLWVVSCSEKLDSNLDLTIIPAINYSLTVNDNQVFVNFNTSLQNGTSYQVTFQQLSDIHGNSSKDTTLVIQYLSYDSAGYRDVVINEIFADPSPQYNLPNHEYLELYNASDKVINLENWVLTNSGEIMEIPSFTLLPKTYVLLCSASAWSDLSQFGDVISISNWVALSNEQDDLMLKNEKEVIIDELNYSDTWYGNEDKKQGGWSLEQIDPTIHCTTPTNWMASSSLLNGTPNQINSVNHIGHDVSPPRINQIQSVNNNQVVLKISEPLDPFINISAFSDPYLENLIVEYSDTKQLLTLSNISLSVKTPYTFIISLTDCAQNSAESISPVVYLPEQANKNDVVINELLFNPYPGGVDFVEIYNRSDKFISIQGWKLASDKKTALDYSSNLTNSFYILQPDDLLYVCEDIESIKNYYATGALGLVISNIPAMNDDEGNMMLITPDSLIIDQVFYSDKDHLNAIQNTEGISLEKINPSMESNNTHNNWHSAASSVNYATPGLINSQFTPSENIPSLFAIKNKRISPNNDGIDDLLEIIINTEPGIGIIKIFSLTGSLIADMNGINVFGTNDTFYWDGMTKDGQLASAGNYILLIEITLETGEVKRFKDAFAVVINN
jgi:hypothetical protein